jgi:Heterokaryon incompatibility protein (HET)
MTSTPVESHPDGDGPDAALAEDLPIPEVRQRRSNAHMDKNKLRELWYKAVPKLNESRKKRSRLVPGDEFQYTRLKKGEIRLLCIRNYKAGEPTSPLFARVFTRRLEEVRGRYEALSYTWGDQSTRPREEIHLRNVSHTLPDINRDNVRQMVAAAAMRLKFYRFPIYKNLYDALMQLRGGLKPVILWVDAICIDQSENGEEEKRQQLRIMDDIYKSAANVCVWTGGGFRGSNEGVQLAREITNFQTFDKRIASGAAEQRWPELIRLLKSPWFSRRWIIQEIALARDATLHCGRNHIHWEDFAECVSLLLDRIDHLRKSFRDEIFDDVETSSGFVLVAMLDSVCRKSDKGDILSKMCDLETLVSTLLGFQATHPKDTIFSVLSLAKDPPQADEEWERVLHGASLKRLDRAKSVRSDAAATDSTEPVDSSIFFKYQLSTRDVFIAFVTRSIYNSRSLDLVCRHWAPPVLDRYGKEVAMPSWVSPLSRSPYGLVGTFKGRQNSDNLVAYSPDDRRKRYNATGSSPATIAMLDDQSPEFEAAHPPLNIVFKLSTIVDNVVQSPIALPSPGVESVVDPPKTGFPPITNGNTDAGNASKSPAPTPGPGGAVWLGPPANPHKPSARQAKFAKLLAGAGRQRRGSLLQREATLQPPDSERAHHLSGVLSVQGFVVGHVQHVSDVMRGGIVPGGWVERLGWGDDGDGADDPNRVPESLWRTLVADRTPRGGHPPPWYKRACLHALHDPSNTDGEGNLHAGTPGHREISEHSAMYLRRVESVVWNRRLFLADMNDADAGAPNGNGGSAGLKGPLFGIGPSETDHGHRVCILLGCSVPVVLCEGKRRGLLRIVGEAYVHGIMDGEAMYLQDKVESFLLE